MNVCFAISLFWILSTEVDPSWHLPPTKIEILDAETFPRQGRAIPPPVPAQVLQTTLEWRQTKSGWQEIPVQTWVTIPEARIPPAKPFLVHPLMWSGLLLLSVFLTATWATNEWERQRLFDE